MSRVERVAPDSRPCLSSKIWRRARARAQLMAPCPRPVSLPSQDTGDTPPGEAEAGAVESEGALSARDRIGCRNRAKTPHSDTCLRELPNAMQLRGVVLALALLVVSAKLNPEHKALIEQAKQEEEEDGRISRLTVKKANEFLHQVPNSVGLLMVRGRGYVFEEMYAIKELGITDLRKALKIGTKAKRKDLEPAFQDLVKVFLITDKAQEAHETWETYGYPLSAAQHQSISIRFGKDADDAGVLVSKTHAKKALEAAPEDPLSHICLAFATVATKKPKPDEVTTMAVQAEEALVTAFKLQKENDIKLPVNWEAQARHLLGSLIFKKGPAEENTRLQEAMVYFEEAAALAEKDYPDEHKTYLRSIAMCKKYADEPCSRIHNAKATPHRASGPECSLKPLRAETARSRRAVRVTPLGIGCSGYAPRDARRETPA